MVKYLFDAKEDDEEKNGPGGKKHPEAKNQKKMTKNGANLTQRCLICGRPLLLPPFKLGDALKKSRLNASAVN